MSLTAPPMRGILFSCIILLFYECCDDLDLDAPRGDESDLESTARGWVGGKEFEVDFVEGGEVSDIGEETGCFDDMVEVATACFKYGLDVVQHLARLFTHVFRDRFSGCWMSTNLTRGEDKLIP